MALTTSIIISLLALGASIATPTSRHICKNPYYDTTSGHLLKFPKHHKETDLEGKVNPVNLTLYFESLCPGCREFVTVELTNTWAKLKDSGILEVNLVPFGNAKEIKVGDKYNYTCQHGYLECFGNYVETCAIHYNPKFDDHFPFISCFEKSFGATHEWSTSLNSCASQTNIPADPINACVSGEEAWKLEHQMALRTGPHQYVPWTIIDGKERSDAMTNLLEVVCEAYKGTRPSACPNAKE